MLACFRSASPDAFAPTTNACADCISPQSQTQNEHTEGEQDTLLRAYLYNTADRRLEFLTQINRIQDRGIEPYFRLDPDIPNVKERKAKACRAFVAHLASIMTDRWIEGKEGNPEELSQAIVELRTQGKCMRFDRRKVRMQSKVMFLSSKVKRKQVRRKKEGYLEVLIGRDGRGKQVRICAHRFLCWVVNGLPPEGKNLCMHSCDTSRCCYNGHLRWGSATENHPRRAIERARQASMRNLNGL